MNIKLTETIARIRECLKDQDVPKYVLMYLSTVENDLSEYPGERDKWVMSRPSLSWHEKDAQWDLLLYTLKDFLMTQKIVETDVEFMSREQYRRELPDSFFLGVTAQSLRKFNERLLKYTGRRAFGYTTFDMSHRIGEGDEVIVLPTGDHWDLVKKVFTAIRAK